MFLHTSLRRSLLSISPTTYLSISFLEALCTELCSKRSNVQSILQWCAFFLLYLCPWTSLDVRQPKLLAMVLNSTEVGKKESFISISRKSQQTYLLHLVWWHCWHSSRNSLSEKVRRRTPKRQECKANAKKAKVFPVGARPSQAPLAADNFPHRTNI